MSGKPLAFCQKNHKIAELVYVDGKKCIRYSALVTGVKDERGHFSQETREITEPVESMQPASYEVRCKHGDGGQLDFMEVLRVIREERGPIKLS